MQRQLTLVKQFQKTFGAGAAEIPQLIKPHTAALRFKLMAEENHEYLEATENEDLVAVADSLGDQLFVLCGTILEHGMPNIIEDVLEEIARSNMSKTDENGKPIINGENGVLDETRPLGKVLKSERYTEPNLKPIIDRALEVDRGDRILQLLQKIDLLKSAVRGGGDDSTKAYFQEEINKAEKEIAILRIENNG